MTHATSLYTSITTDIRVPALTALRVDWEPDSDTALRLFLGQSYYDKALKRFQPCHDATTLKGIERSMTGAYMTPKAFQLVQCEMKLKAGEVLRWLSQPYWVTAASEQHLAIAPGKAAVTMSFYGKWGVEVTARIDASGRVWDDEGKMVKAARLSDPLDLIEAREW